jgi:hypothetical protein
MTVYNSGDEDQVILLFDVLLTQKILTFMFVEITK